MRAAREVVVTGLGAVTACGQGVPALWRAVRDGSSAVGPLSLARPARNRILIGAQVQGIDLDAAVPPALRPACERFSALALVAAAEAVGQAGLDQGGLPGTHGPRTAAIIGTGVGGAATIEAGVLTAHEGGRLDPYSVPRLMPNAAASLVGARWQVAGPTFAVASACASGAQAIGLGALLIRSGIADLALVGGAEASLTAAGLRSWEALRVLSPDVCRPFSRDRNGLVLGEGAAVLVLEAADHAERRGVPPLVRLLGYGTSGDAGDPVRPHPAGAARAMSLALAEAGLDPEAIDYVNAHGTGTLANDAAEAQALSAIFGDRLFGLPVSSTKPVHGHALGAAGAIELVVTIMALREGIAPPTLNWTAPDAEHGFDPVSGAARATDIRAALSNSFAFGGINAALVVGRA